MVSEINSSKRAEIKNKSVIGLPNTVTGKPDMVKNAIFEPVNIVVTELNRIVGETNDEIATCNDRISKNDDLIKSIQTTTENSAAKIIDKVYPVGAIYISTASTSPASLFGGTWQPINNRFLYASGKYSAGSTGGSETHVLNVNEMPSHGKHIPYGGESTSGGSAAGKFLAARAFDSYGATGRGWNNLSSEYYPYTFDLGGNRAHNNMPPYLVVYMWKRVA